MIARVDRSPGAAGDGRTAPAAGGAEAGGSTVEPGRAALHAAPRPSAIAATRDARAERGRRMAVSPVLRCAAAGPMRHACYGATRSSGARFVPAGKNCTAGFWLADQPVLMSKVTETCGLLVRSMSTAWLNAW